MEEDNNKEMSKKTILIFGISSFVGSNLAEFLKKDYRVIGTYHKNPVKIEGVLTLPCDVLTKEEVQLILFSFKPDVTIYCAGLSSLVECAKSEELAEALNSSGLFNVAEYCQRYKSKICYISSSFVFGGEEKEYIEMDIPDANTSYGKTQASAEFYIQKTSLNYLILRCCRLYGRGINPLKQTWFELIQHNLYHNQGFVCDDYLKIGFLDVYYLGMILKLCIERNIGNRLFQVSSSDILSYYEFTKLYCDTFGHGKEAISKGRWPFPFLASQTTSAPSGDELFYEMNVSNVEGFLKIRMPTIKESLEFTLRRFNGQLDKNKKSRKGEGITFI